jgi:hypothetical protein
MVFETKAAGSSRRNSRHSGGFNFLVLNGCKEYYCVHKIRQGAVLSFHRQMTNRRKTRKFGFLLVVLRNSLLVICFKRHSSLTSKGKRISGEDSVKFIIAHACTTRLTSLLSTLHTLAPPRVLTAYSFFLS